MRRTLRPALGFPLSNRHTTSKQGGSFIYFGYHVLVVAALDWVAVATPMLRLTGTLGVLLDAKRVGFIQAMRPLLEQLNALGFRLAPHTHAAILKLARGGMMLL